MNTPREIMRGIRAEERALNRIMSSPKTKALKKKSGWEEKGGINEHGKYCNHCASPSHKSHEHAGLVKKGKISR